MRKRIPHILIFSMTSFLLLASCKKPVPISFAGYRNMRFSNEGFSTGIIRMDVAFYNPNPFPLKIKETALQILIDQKPFGKITQDSTSLMEAKDTFLMPVSLKINLIDLLSKVMRTAQEDSILLQATGSCKIGRKGIFTTIPLKYESKKSLKMF